MTTVWHLLPRRDVPADPDGVIAPDSLPDIGFVHCSPDEASTLAVANTLYRDATGPMVALELDVAALSAPVRFEPPIPRPPDGVPAHTLFPHVYGPLNCSAIVAIRSAVRDESGRYLAFADEPDPGAEKTVS